MIKVRDIYKTFKTADSEIKAVDGVSFDVKKGEVYGIIGLSGAGKSTLVRCLNLLEKPTSGDVIVNEKTLNKLSHRELLDSRKEIAMIFQHFNLFDQRNVYDNVAYPLEIMNLDKGTIKSRVEEVLDFVGLLDRKDAYPSELSGGQKQRVAIARALGTRPKVLLSDESTSALDPANTDSILSLLRESIEKYDTTVVMITHQMEVAKAICDRIAVMEDGKIIEENTVEEIFTNPKTSRTKSFIDSLPDVIEDDFDKEEYDGTILRLNFDKDTAKRPIINEIMKESDCLINILSGNLSSIKGREKVGYLVVELIGEDKDCQAVIDRLEQELINVEVL